MTMSFMRARPTAPVARRQRFAELATVRLTRDMEVDGRMLPKESAGTVVGVYAGGKGYEVEFAHPFHAVVTLDVSDLAA